MSTDQPELSDFGGVDAATPHEDALEGVGAAYVPREEATPSAPRQEPESICLNCGADVEPRIARVLGDNNGCIPVCAEPECRKDVIGDGVNEHEYVETTRIVRAYRAESRGQVADGGGR